MESQETNTDTSVEVASFPLWIGGAFLAVGVVSGALAAHFMERVLDADGVHAFETASHYLLFMGSAVLGASASRRVEGLKWVAIGTVLFCGSIFGLLLGKAVGVPLAVLGPVTPLGGVLMIAGWLRWTWATFRATRG